MSNKSRIAAIPEYFSYLLKQYRQLQQQNVPVDKYRIVEIKEKKNGRVELTIQIIGKNVIFKADPEKIAGDDQMLNHFSRQDVRTLTYFATQEVKKPKYKILVKEFCSAFNKMIFSLEKRDEKKVSQKTADELSNDKNILKDLSPEEAHLIGYTAAAEKVQSDQDQQEAIHDKKIPKHKIIKQEYSESLGKTIYTLEEQGSHKHKQTTAKEISKNKKIIKGLTPEDAHRIGIEFDTESKSEQ